MDAGDVDFKLGFTVVRVFWLRQSEGGVFAK